MNSTIRNHQLRARVEGVSIIQIGQRVVGTVTATGFHAAAAGEPADVTLARRVMGIAVNRDKDLASLDARRKIVQLARSFRLGVA